MQLTVSGCVREALVLPLFVFPLLVYSSKAAKYQKKEKHYFFFLKLVRKDNAHEYVLLVNFR